MDNNNMDNNVDNNNMNNNVDNNMNSIYEARPPRLQQEAVNRQNATTATYSYSANTAQNRVTRPVRKGQFQLFGVASIIYGIFFAFCLYSNPQGITFPFYSVGTIVYLVYCINKFSPIEKGQLFARSGNKFYIISIVLLGISIFLTTDVSAITLAKIGIFLLTISFCLHNVYDDSKWNFHQYLIAITSFIVNIVENFNTPFGDITLYIKEHRNSVDEEGNPVEKKNSVIPYILLGLAISIPIVIVIVSLLCRADVVFAKAVGKFVEFLNINNIIHVLIDVLFAYFIFYSMLAGLSKKSYSPKDIKAPDYAAALGITITSVISVIYLAFSLIQIVYLFLGQLELPEGYTYASYAKTGFYELLAVCIINLVMVLVFLSVFKKHTALNIILTIICCCTYIMIASSALRMYIYVCAYNLTKERLFTFLALIVISVLMVGLMIYIYRRDTRLFRYCMIVITCATIFYVFSHSDYWIARYNLSHYGERVDKFEEDQKVYIDLDTKYLLNELSDDAAPVIMNVDNFKIIYNSTSSQGKIKNYYQKHKTQKEDGMTFRTFNVSTCLANIAFKNNIEENYKDKLYHNSDPDKTEKIFNNNSEDSLY